MSRSPDFAAYHVATVRDGQWSPQQDGDWTVYDDGSTFIYRGIDTQHAAQFFAWASAIFCNGDEPARLVGSARDGWCVERGFQPPQPIPPDDSDEYQRWLDGPYASARATWESEHAPA
jgi:hypothetical protein